MSAVLLNYACSSLSLRRSDVASNHHTRLEIQQHVETYPDQRSDCGPGSELLPRDIQEQPTIANKWGLTQTNPTLRHSKEVFAYH